ncbi:hypothetical protein E2C01_021690 [Portunus trituberculatus]|uniref:Uncharacterized protein n=1 Tax=Portunus trituberculatus TaxID=210409 RepID=A0A5B7E6T8_PORTR|nr:hypothetical protein [Portunus trituberculatus]
METDKKLDTTIHASLNVEPGIRHPRRVLVMSRDNSLLHQTLPHTDGTMRSRRLGGLRDIPLSEHALNCLR